MNTRRLAALLCAALAATLLLTGLARAAPALDQQQTTVDPDQWFLVGGSGPQILGQTVTSGVAGLLTQVDLPVACAPGSDLVLQIRDSSGDDPGHHGARLSHGLGYPGHRGLEVDHARALHRSSRTRPPSRSCSPHPERARAQAGPFNVDLYPRGAGYYQGPPVSRRESGLRRASSSASRRTSMRSARCPALVRSPAPDGPARSRSTAVRSVPSRAPTRGTWRRRRRLAESGRRHAPARGEQDRRGRQPRGATVQGAERPANAARTGEGNPDPRALPGRGRPQGSLGQGDEGTGHPPEAGARHAPARRQPRAPRGRPAVTNGDAVGPPSGGPTARRQTRSRTPTPGGR